MRNLALMVAAVVGPVAAAAALVGTLGLTHAPQNQPRPSSPATPATVPDPAPAIAADPLKNFAFLAGTWRGTVGQDHVEEIWSAPSGDSIVGTFRWVSAGKTTLFEFLTIKAQDNDAILRLRHFNAGFEPWKGECDGVDALKAITIEPAKVVFENTSDIPGIAGCDYWVKDNTLFIKVRFANANRPPLEFELHKVK